MKIVVLIGHHEHTILVGSDPRKFRNTPIALDRSDAYEIERKAELCRSKLTAAVA